MTCSLIITTYNWKEALELVLDSALKQSESPEEIIIADDGSRDDTRSLISLYQAKSNIEILHSWQKDDGFRVAKSRNEAIKKAKGDYIVLIDGDIILHKNFIKDHKQFAQKGYFIQGGRVLLGKNYSEKLLKFKKFNISFFEKNIKNRKNTINSTFLSRIFSNKSVALKGIKTCNMSFYREDAVSINGFNEDIIGWGREDSEFVIRLYNYGIKRKNLKFKANSYHIWHSENKRDSLSQNDKILNSTIKDRLLFCSNGIEKS